MKVYQLDDDYLLSRKKLWPKAFKIALIFIGALWVIYILDGIFIFVRFNQYGILPRDANGIVGIVASPFLHGGLSHIISNTLPLLLAMTGLFGNYPKIAKKVFIYSILLTGFLVWSFARSANHIGASGILYAILTFIFISGFVRKDIQSIGISIVLAFTYGSLIFGIIPNQEHISWESHLFGMISGAFLAWVYRKSEIPVYKSYEEE